MTRPHTTVARAALLIMAGQVASRLLGFVRDAVTAGLFGRGGATDAFFAAQTVSQTAYDLLVGTTITAALIPIFSEHADKENRSELWSLTSVVISLGMLLLSGLTLAAIVFAPQIMAVTVHFPQANDQQLAETLTRIVMPSFAFLGLSGILQSILYSMRRFLASAFCVAAYNGAIVICALTLHKQLGVAALAVGMVAGSGLMVAIQLPALLNQHMRFSFSLDLKNPEVRRLGKLYLPVAGLMLITILGIVVDRNLASRVGEGSISAMQYATKIVQLPLGLISTALGVAILPTLSRHALEAGLGSYKAVLTKGLKFVLLLILPMTVVVLALNQQILALVYQHGQYTAADRQVTGLALYLYAPELPFAAIDYLLISAFYALKNTLVPALLGAAGVVVYLIVALSLVAPLGMPGLVLGTTVKDSMHGIILLMLLWRQVDGLRGYQLLPSLLKLLAAAGAMALVCYGAAGLVSSLVGLESFRDQVVQFLIPLALGSAAYFVVAWFLKVEELNLAWQMVAARIRPA